MPTSLSAKSRWSLEHPKELGLEFPNISLTRKRRSSSTMPQIRRVQKRWFGGFVRKERSEGLGKGGKMAALSSLTPCYIFGIKLERGGDLLF